MKKRGMWCGLLGRMYETGRDSQGYCNGCGHSSGYPTCSYLGGYLMAIREEIRDGIESRIRDVITASQVGEYHSVSIATEGIMNYLHSQGVVIKVDRELPRYEGGFINALWDAMKMVNDENECKAGVKAILAKAGYEATESLIKEE